MVQTIKAHGGEIKGETSEARPDDPVGRGKEACLLFRYKIRAL